jgi:tRNA pseudouridine38-40 synthase
VDPLRRGSVVWHDRPLDESRMNAAAELLVGEHDFASFCRKREGATTVRCLQEFSWARETPNGAEVGPAFRPVIVATVRADAFCHNMVRSLVGAMLAVGTGRKPVDWPREVLGRAVRDSGVHVAPAHGLTLEEVAYPSDELLAARVTATRRRRDGS